MPRLSVDFSHTLSQDEAARRFKERLAAARAEYQDHLSDFHEEWQANIFSFAFRALGLAISGSIAVEPDKVRLRANLPLAVMVFKSTIENHLRQEVDKLLAVSPGTAAS